MLSTAEAADRLGVSAQRVRQLLERGKLGGTQVSGVWVVDDKSVDDRIAMLNKQAVNEERRRKERRERRKSERRQA